MTNVESHELDFLNKIHEMTSRADTLIKQYIVTAAKIEELPPNTLPGQEEAYELAMETAILLNELKITVVKLVEHSSEINDQVQSVLARINIKKE